MQWTVLQWPTDVIEVVALLLSIQEVSCSYLGMKTGCHVWSIHVILQAHVRPDISTSSCFRVLPGPLEFISIYIIPMCEWLVSHSSSLRAKRWGRRNSWWSSNIAQPDGSTLEGEINPWFAVRIKIQLWSSAWILWQPLTWQQFGLLFATCRTATLVYKVSCVWSSLNKARINEK
jgi:hypothetical protein